MRTFLIALVSLLTLVGCGGHSTGGGFNATSAPQTNPNTDPNTGGSATVDVTVTSSTNDGDFIQVIITVTNDNRTFKVLYLYGASGGESANNLSTATPAGNGSPVFIRTGEVVEIVIGDQNPNGIVFPILGDDGFRRDVIVGFSTHAPISFKPSEIIGSGFSIPVDLKGPPSP